MANNQREFIFDVEEYSRMKYLEYETIATHAIQWEGLLPPGLESEDIELMLLKNPGIAMFDCMEGIFLLPFAQETGLNIYGKPVGVRPVPINGEPVTMRPGSPAVILWDNPTHNPFGVFLRTISDRLADIQLSISVAEWHARIPAIIAVQDGMKLEQVMRVMTKKADGYPIIPVDTPTGQTVAGSIATLDTGFSPEVLRILWEDYAKVESEGYNLIGTPYNLEQNKASGVGAAETAVNLAQTLAFAYARLKQRERFAAQINALYAPHIEMYPRMASNYEDVIMNMLRGGKELGYTEGGVKDENAVEVDG